MVTIIKYRSMYYAVVPAGLLGLCFLLSTFGGCQGQMSSCKVKPIKYSFKSTTTDPVPTGCSMSGIRPAYFHCTGDTLPLSDDDLGPSCDTTDQQERFYIRERSPETTHSLLLTFSHPISPTHIRLHYFSDPANGIGVPSLKLYANIENPWDPPTGTDVRIASVRAMLNDVSEPPHREILDITPQSSSLQTLLLQIIFFSGNAVSSFYLSEVEVFTCSPGPTPVTRCYSSETEDTVSTVTTVPIGGEYTSQPTDPVTPTSTVKGTSKRLSSTPGQIENQNGTPTDDSDLSSDWAPWALTGLFAVLFLSTSTTTIVLAVLVWRRRKEPPKAQFELDTNPSYSCPKEVATGLSTGNPKTETHIYDNADLIA